MTNRTFLIWGASGHAKMLKPIIEDMGDRIGAYVDLDPSTRGPDPQIACMHSFDEAAAWTRANRDKQLCFAIAIGGVRGNERLAIHDELSSLGLEPVTLVHHTAWVGPTASLGEGVQVLPMAAVCEEAVLGRQCIVNTKASVDHECQIGDGVHIMPSATLAGCVRVGDHATIGSNATLLPRITIGSGAVVGAGAVVLRDVPPGGVVAGNPARPIDKTEDGRS